MTRARAHQRELQQRHARPTRAREIVSIGAGGIVRLAHAPAYARAGFVIRGVYDLRPGVARRLARDLGGARVFSSLDEAFLERDVVFDVAVPPAELEGLVGQAPRGAAMLVQKPLGRDLAEARAIVALARRRRLTMAVNFQLRFAPASLALADLIGRGVLGRVREVELRVVTRTPFERWTFLRRAPRVEILYHSVHYLDLLRALFGEPSWVRARASRDPAFPGLADTRSAIELAFEGGIRAGIRTDHRSLLPRDERVSELRVEGARGIARVRLGVNLDYANPAADELAVRTGARWRAVRLVGSWFPDAFEGPMSNLQRFVAGEDRVLRTRAEDALRTMELVERCYQWSAR